MFEQRTVSLTTDSGFVKEYKCIGEKREDMGSYYLHTLYLEGDHPEVGGHVWGPKSGGPETFRSYNVPKTDVSIVPEGEMQEILSQVDHFLNESPTQPFEPTLQPVG